jgi:hypothetical protein
LCVEDFKKDLKANSPFVEKLFESPMRARIIANEDPGGRSVKVGPKKPTVQERANL